MADESCLPYRKWSGKRPQISVPVASLTGLPASATFGREKISALFHFSVFCQIRVPEGSKESHGKMGEKIDPEGIT